ncbi:hypothetical protein [Fulvivirga sediminis]|uniref:Uncharacterized protein n=1 Tax=Fulvivirga sediminis TaxID=2803949 RepID=A0A937F5S3_9BACT|nr:hypothetical protein [Fulvivirga sediminis]MBL3655477.1 hypothetical protein [Fulvivirga sediminis]
MLFETNEFGLSQEGFHLLRDRFNYKTYPYSEIDKIRIETGKALEELLKEKLKDRLTSTV